MYRHFNLKCERSATCGDAHGWTNPDNARSILSGHEAVSCNLTGREFQDDKR